MPSIHSPHRSLSSATNIHILEHFKGAPVKPGDIPTSVRNLLLTTKEIQDTLERYTQGPSSSSSKDVNDLYCQLMSDYQTVLQAFRYHQMDLSELQAFPRQLRSILEHWLGDPVPEHAFRTYMPQLRQTLALMLAALDSRQEMWRSIQWQQPGTRR